MGRHVVVPFQIVPISGITIRGPSARKHFEITPHRGICVFSNHQGTTGVLHKDVNHTRLNRRVSDVARHFSGDFQSTATAGLNVKAMLMGNHD